MGYPTVENFDIAFVKRTRKNLDDLRDGVPVQNDFTMLLNSLLGLVIVPNEINIKGRREFHENPFDKPLAEFPVLKAILEGPNAKIETEEGDIYTQRKFGWFTVRRKQRSVAEVTLGQFLRRVRNGVAHFGIMPTKHGANRWKGIIVKNFPSKTDPTFCDFEMYLEQDEIEKIARLIADEFLNNARI
jgi:hypothetical protein